MDWIASLFSSSGVSFRSGAVATKMAEGSERRFRLLRHNNVKRKSRTNGLTDNVPGSHECRCRGYGIARKLFGSFVVRVLRIKAGVEKGSIAK